MRLYTIPCCSVHSIIFPTSYKVSPLGVKFTQTLHHQLWVWFLPKPNRGVFVIFKNFSLLNRQWKFWSPTKSLASAQQFLTFCLCKISHIRVDFYVCYLKYAQNALFFVRKRPLTKIYKNTVIKKKNAVLRILCWIMFLVPFIEISLNIYQPYRKLNF